MSGEQPARWRAALPVLALTVSAAVYVEVAVRRALPALLPTLLDRAVVPETELRANLVLAFRVIAVTVPAIAWLVAASFAWLALRRQRPAPSFPNVLRVAASSSWWIAAGLAVKTLLVLVTGQPDPAVNAGAFVQVEGFAARALVALTNPFVLLAIATMIVGLHASGTSWRAAALGGGAPWAIGAMGLAVLFGGNTRFEPDALVPTEDWPELSESPITLRYAPGADDDAGSLVHLMDAFAKRLGERLGFEPAALRIHVYADHAMLERAAGERLHVQVVGSVRGQDLLYLEMPGSSAAMTQARGLREALRYVGLVELAPVASAAPRWWVEGFVHAAVHPGNAELDRDFRAALRRIGVPAYERLLETSFFRGPEGPLMARSLVDHVAFLEGADAPERIMRDVIAGETFRDALFAHTRLTTTALEAGWRETLLALPEAKRGAGADSVRAPADTGRLDEVVPFLKGP